jgi:hypothetical protein
MHVVSSWNYDHLALEITVLYIEALLGRIHSALILLWLELAAYGIVDEVTEVDCGFLIGS